jgi:hypothetical protein
VSTRGLGEGAERLVGHLWGEELTEIIGWELKDVPDTLVGASTSSSLILGVGALAAAAHPQRCLRVQAASPPQTDAEGHWARGRDAHPPHTGWRLGIFAGGKVQIHRGLGARFRGTRLLALPAFCCTLPCQLSATSEILRW